MYPSITKHSFLFLIACIALAISCKTKQKAFVGNNPAIDTTVTKAGVDKELIEDKPADSLLKVIRQKELTFKTLTAKVDVMVSWIKTMPHSTATCGWLKTVLFGYRYRRHWA